MGIDKMDKSFVSRMVQDIEAEVSVFKARPLEGEFPYVFVDARYEKVRREGRVTSMAVLVAVGVRMDGHREVLGMEPKVGERHVLWRDFLQDLSNRGCAASA